MIRERVKRGVAQHTNQLVVYVDMHAFDDHRSGLARVEVHGDAPSTV
jgi:hypothetical protein